MSTWLLVANASRARLFATQATVHVSKDYTALKEETLVKKLDPLA